VTSQLDKCNLSSSLGGADFEIIPTNNILPTHHLWADSLHFPPRVGCFFHGKQVRPEKSEATRPIPWHQDRQASQLWGPDSAVGELGGDASFPSSACIAFLRLAPFHKFWQIKLASVFPCFVPDLMVWYLNLKVSPTEWNWLVKFTTISLCASNEGMVTERPRKKEKYIWSARQVNRDLTSWFCFYWSSTLFNHDKYSCTSAFFDLIERLKDYLLNLYLCLFFWR